MQGRIVSFIHFSLAMALFVAAGCGVSKDKYDSKVEKVSELQKELDKTKAKLKKQDDQILLLKSSVETQKAKAEGAEERAENAKQMVQALKKKFAEQIKATETEVEMLAKAKLAEDKRTKLEDQLSKQFRSLIEKEQLALKSVHGRMVIKLSSRVLFQSGSAELTKRGQEALEEVAKVLKDIKGSHFQIAGHTDAIAITKGDYKDNWDLSTARALVVLKFLAEKGVPAKLMSAAGFAQYQPVATNRTSWGRQANRRIEISVLPRIPRKLMEKRPGR